MRLEGKIALVTGGASGIGAATARRLAADGARVAIGDIAEHGARELAGELDGLACHMDVADPVSVREAVAEIERELGPVDVLVNNAGTDRFAFFVNTDEELWDLVIGVNLRGTMAVTHAVLGGMQQRRSGSIVNVASEAGRVGSQGSAVYSAAKAGVIGFTNAIEHFGKGPLDIFDLEDANDRDHLRRKVHPRREGVDPHSARRLSRARGARGLGGRGRVPRRGPICLPRQPR
jgi:2-hydroxycyclohexanecarboxyl-CoA dehydrogenase